MMYWLIGIGVFAVVIIGLWRFGNRISDYLPASVDDDDYWE